MTISNQEIEEKIKNQILTILAKHGEIGWYGLDMRVTIDRRDFPRMTTVMTFVHYLHEDGKISCNCGDDLGAADARYWLTPDGEAHLKTLATQR